jgi:predicted ATPase
VYLTETGCFVEAEAASRNVLHLGSHETEKDLMWADWEVFVSQLQQQKLVQYG